MLPPQTCKLPIPCALMILHSITHVDFWKISHIPEFSWIFHFHFILNNPRPRNHQNNLILRLLDHFTHVVFPSVMHPFQSLLKCSLDSVFISNSSCEMTQTVFNHCTVSATICCPGSKFSELCCCHWIQTSAYFSNSSQISQFKLLICYVHPVFN